MIFRTVGAMATLLIGFTGHVVAQYYPPPQGYPRQPLPPAVTTEDRPPVNVPVMRGDALPPVGPAYQSPPGGINREAPVIQLMPHHGRTIHVQIENPNG